MATTEEQIIATQTPAFIAVYTMTYEEYLDWEPESGLSEWVYGKVYLYMSTTREHQRVVDFLNGVLQFFVKLMQLGVVTTGPYAMRAAPNGAGREPDLFFVSTENLARITSRQLEGPADLVVEVISDDSVMRDRDEKFFEYQQVGIREYWIIDPRPNRLRADFYVLDDQGTYRAVPVGDGHIYRSTVLANFWLKVDWLWEEQPNPLTAFAQIVGPERMLAAFQPNKE